MSEASDTMARWRWPVLTVLGIIAVGVLIAALQPAPPGYLDPNDTGPQGGHALADLLTARGEVLDRESSVAAAVTAARQGDDLLLVTGPEFFTSAQLRQLAAAPGDVLLTDPDAAGLAAFAPDVQLVGTTSLRTLPPACGAQGARLAGDADVGGTLLRSSEPGVFRCYPNGDGYSLITYSSAGRNITVLDSSAPLTNQFLADQGNAALAMNLLGSRQRVIWLVPSVGNPLPAAPSPGQRSFLSLVPRPAYLVALQLFVAALLAAAWRGRRLGPVVSERLPVVVHASETVEGHGRLYHSRRARGRAADALRAAARARLAEALGIPGTEGLVAAVATRARRGPGAVERLLDGAAPRTDEELVGLATELDTLEREVRQP